MDNAYKKSFQIGVCLMALSANRMKALSEPIITRIINLKTNQSERSVDGNHPAWSIIIPRLDFLSQMKISQQNKRLAEIVEFHAEYELKKFRREIQKDISM